MIGSKYISRPYKLIQNNIIEQTSNSDFVIGNLESPLAITASTDGDHLQFKGEASILPLFNWINVFSLANNHITDCGLLGIEETIKLLENNNFLYNGVFKDSYKPLILKSDDTEISLITFTDMLNIPFPENSDWNVLRMGDTKITNIIKEEHEKGRFIIVFAHVGILFTRYPNPITYEYLHNCIDSGADIIITAHSHCLGGMEYYKGKPIFHSLGDFCMDGNSFRRRTAAMLNMEISNNQVKSWEIIPTFVDDELTITLLENSAKSKVINKFNQVSKNIETHSSNYVSFFKRQYKKEIIEHSISTIKFLVHQRGILGLLKMLMKRSTEVGRTVKWTIKDRSKDQRDDEAIKPDRKKFSQKDLFGK